MIASTQITNSKIFTFIAVLNRKEKTIEIVEKWANF